jgi:putative NIF3 family GTP cyclohydrolase 1 type 2
MKMLCLGHYATEVWGVRSLSAAMKKALGVQVFDLT